MENKKKTGLSRLFEIAGENKALLLLAGVLSAMSAVCMLAPYYSVYEVLKELLSCRSDITLVDRQLIFRCAWIAIGGLLAGLLLLYLSLISSHVSAFNTLYGLRVKLSDHIGRLPLRFLSETSIGAVKKTMEQNVEKVETFIAHTIPDLVNVGATVVFMLAIFLSLNVWLSVVCIVVVLISIVLQFSSFFGGEAKEFTRLYFDAQEKMSASAVQYVRGMPVIKVFGQSVRSFKQFTSEIYAYKKYALNVCDTYQNGMVSFTVLLNSIVTFILPVGIILMTRNPESLALASVYLFFIILGPGVASPVYKLLYLGSSTREIDEGVKRIDAIFDNKPVQEPLCPKTPTSFDVEFRNVSFSYENKSQATRTLALKGISFKAEQGSVTALVGPSGGGKSTVANLIPRFYDVDEGEILIGGVNVKDIATCELMNTVSFVFQDTFLFYDTIYENIAVGIKNATAEDVVRASVAAQCHDFIEKLPQGYATKIGEGGVFLSGGEAQRICIARAILKNAPILVLDEATAFADPENEYKMQQALKSLIRNKTVIIIAHRLSTITLADTIVVLKDGVLVQKGTHKEMSEKEGVYKNMWEAFSCATNWKLNIQTAN